ncbi:MAG TPA: hypothetical protein VG674_16700 [Amycolatopsis sp.]|nr:hypothetical protein [Amycolatopsis sp.]
MRDSMSNVAKLARLQAEFDAENRKVINPNGGRNRQALLRMSELADQMVRIYEEEADQMRRVAAQAYDLAITK